MPSILYATPSNRSTATSTVIMKGQALACRWMKTFGDPRTPGVDPVDWIESIPFNETRNYVQRILESLVVYRKTLGVPDSDPVIASHARFRSLAENAQPD